MDKDGLIIGIGGLLLAVLTYFAGVIRTERRHVHMDSEARIATVLHTYLAAAGAGRANGFHGLMQAGVATLESDAEIRSLMKRLVQHDPRWDPRKVLEGVNTHEFFKKAIESRCDFVVAGSAESLADQLRRKAS